MCIAWCIYASCNTMQYTYLTPLVVSKLLYQLMNSNNNSYDRKEIIFVLLKRHCVIRQMATDSDPPKAFSRSHIRKKAPSNLTELRPRDLKTSCFDISAVAVPQGGGDRTPLRSWNNFLHSGVFAKKLFLLQKPNNYPLDLDQNQWDHCKTPKTSQRPQKPRQGDQLIHHCSSYQNPGSGSTATVDYYHLAHSTSPQLLHVRISSLMLP